MIRRLGPEDATGYRALRLEALRGEPTAFGASAEEEAAQPLARFAARLSSSVVLGALADGALVGTAGYYLADGAKSAHIGFVVGVWVTPAARRAGHARALLAGLVEHAARDGLLVLRLSVGTGNAPAIALYRSAGFEIYGTERAALCVDGVFVDEHLMERYLRAP
jgi:ribosomal protein S18 acetylase RimI-like enzyme